MVTPLIDINLSDELQRLKKKSAPRKQMPMALAVIVVVTFATLAVFYTFVNVHSQRLASNKSALEKLQASFEETGKFQKLYDELRDKIAMLNGMQTRRVTWYKRWRALSELAPKELYLTEIILSHTDAVGEEQRLVLNGRAFGAGGEDVVLQYLDLLKQSPEFASVFPRVALASVHTEGNEKVFSIELTRASASGEQR